LEATVKRVLISSTLAVAMAFGLGAYASAAGDSKSNHLKATLEGFQEINAATAAVSTTGSGSLDLRIDDDAQTIAFELSYDNLEGVGTTPFVTNGVVTQAHIHVGARGTSGGVSVFFCGGAGRPACPLSGTVTGEWTPADIVGPAAQGINPTEPSAFEELVRALRAGYAYANVHTTRWPSGEIRGQIK
jgi:hypothetical protein